MAALYGPELTSRVALVQAQWLLLVGKLPDFWKQTQPYTAAAPAQATPDPPAKGKPAVAAAALEKTCLERAASILQVTPRLSLPNTISTAATLQ